MTTIETFVKNCAETDCLVSSEVRKAVRTRTDVKVANEVFRLTRRIRRKERMDPGQEDSSQVALASKLHREAYVSAKSMKDVLSASFFAVDPFVAVSP